MPATATEYKDIAKTIKRQIDAAGAMPLTWALGANAFVALNGDSLITHGRGIRGGLMFKVNLLDGKPAKGVKVIVELTGSDDYNVVIGRVRGADWKVLHSHSGIYADMLGHVIADHILDIQED